MDFVKNNIAKWASALVVLVVGILCIVAGAASGEAQANAYDGISITLGVSLLIVAGIVLVLAFVATILSKGEAEFLVAAIAVSITLALGIFFIANKSLGGQLIWIFLNFIPYVLLVVGSIIVVDAILKLIFGLVKKQNVKVIIIACVFALVLAAIAIILGALMVGNDPVISKNAQLIVFGIVLIIFGAFAILATLISLPKPSKKETVVVAEVKVEDNSSTEEKAE